VFVEDVDMLLLFKEDEPKAGEVWDDKDNTVIDVCSWGGGDDIKNVGWFLFIELLPLDWDVWGSVDEEDDDVDEIESEL